MLAYFKVNVAEKMKP